MKRKKSANTFIGRTGLKLFQKSNLIPFFVIFWLVLAILADVIATDRPLAIKTEQGVIYPAFSAILNPHRIDRYKLGSEDKQERILDHDHVDWKQLPNDWVIWAPVPWSHEKPDVYNRDFAAPGGKQKIKSANGHMTDIPFRFRHLMGTDRLGRDLMAMLIHGSRISLKIGLLSTLIAGLIGILLGAFSGYYGNDRLRLGRGSYILAIFGFLIGLFWAFISGSPRLNAGFESGLFHASIQIFLSFAITAVCTILAILAGKLFFRQEVRVSVPVDQFVQRFSEVFSSMPKILILLTLAAVLKDRSVGMVIAIIGLTGWTGVSRYTRAELLRIRELPYIEAARMQGISVSRIIFRHALPNAMGPVIVELSFLVSASILAESSLSFLGIGVPVEVSTWGSILSEGRQDLDAWWMVIFPGLAIFMTVYLFNALGRRFRASQLSRR
ncbi:MAG: ABC transporter permease [Bacteroidetes bacterium]|nr:ABC transporter permease [Bacteroidota bacterium]